MKMGAMVKGGKQGVRGLLQELLLRPSSVCNVSKAINYSTAAWGQFGWLQTRGHDCILNPATRRRREIKKSDTVWNDIIKKKEILKQAVIVKENLSDSLRFAGIPA